MAVPDPILSLVVCTYRRPAAVGRLLDAVAAQTRVPDEVLIVDASPDEATATVAAGHSLRGLVYHRVPDEHRGLTRQRNWAVPRARGDLVAFLDDDVVPEPDYFAEVLACRARHPGAAGVVGFVGGVEWWPASDGSPRRGVYRHRGWERREALRWRVRRALGLVASDEPGTIPPSGHGRSVTYFPPDGEDHPIEAILGGVATWRREVLERVAFSRFFAGYGLYEDLDFGIRARAFGPIYLATRARVRHEHQPEGRPSSFRYGRMVVRNGWFVWRRRWPLPPLLDRGRWWATTLVLALGRLAGALRPGDRRGALLDGLGRLVAMPAVWLRPPRETGP